MNIKLVLPWEQKAWNSQKEKLLKPISSINELDSRIASLQRKFRPRQLSDILHEYFESMDITPIMTTQHFIETLIPFMIDLVVTGPRTFKKFKARILLPNSNSNIVLNRLQVATLISCIWFGLFADCVKGLDDSQLEKEDFQEITFLHGFRNNNKCFLQSILNYFNKIHELKTIDPDSLTSRIIIYKRHSEDMDINLLNNNTTLAPISIGDGYMDESDAKIIIAFAHDVIGGNTIFGSSMSQEELLLLSRPESIPIILFCPRLQDNEVAICFGAEKTTAFKGFSSSMQFAGNFVDTTPCSKTAESLLQNAIVFMDATQKKSIKAQYVTDFVRDIKKAYTGFSAVKLNCNIATGNWNYGFNPGNFYIKFIQQVIAATLAGKSIIYYSPMKDIEDEISKFADWLVVNEITTTALLKLYRQVVYDAFNDDNVRLTDLNIFDAIMDL